jgi:hypothetical protein
MRVQVDETRDQGMSGKLDSARGGVALSRKADGKQVADATIYHYDGVVGERHLWRVDRNDPAGFYDEGNRISQGGLLWKQKSPALRQGF